MSPINRIFHLLPSIVLLGGLALMYTGYQMSDHTAFPFPDNEDRRPLLYATDQYMRESQYQMLDYPYTDLALHSYAVIPDHLTDFDHAASLPALKEIPDTSRFLPSFTLGHSYITPVADGFHVGLEQDTTLHLSLPDQYQLGDTLYLEFHLINIKRYQEITISIEDTERILPGSSTVGVHESSVLTYAVTPTSGQQILNLSLSAGNYLIREITWYSADEDAFYNPRLYLDQFHMTDLSSRSIEGTIDCQNDEYVITRLPYDETFRIRVDDQIVPPVQVNGGYLGFPIQKGTHEIRLTCYPPRFIAGSILYFLGYLLLLLTIFLFKKAGNVPR